jgi:K+-sensing histidine kinase KdpD
LLIQFPLRAELVGGHIRYRSPHDYALVAMAAYLAAVYFCLLFSNHRTMEVLGFVLLLSCIAASVFYALWFVSVWCFFAALLSGMVHRYFRHRRTQDA